MYSSSEREPRGYPVNFHIDNLLLLRVAHDDQLAEMDVDERSEDLKFSHIGAFFLGEPISTRQRQTLGEWVTYAKGVQHVNRDMAYEAGLRQYLAMALECRGGEDTLAKPRRQLPGAERVSIVQHDAEDRIHAPRRNTRRYRSLRRRAR